jgi:asparagine synthase (glutamine-hydrolysing)
LNCPYRTKLRFSPFARRDPVHPFYFDKWILRQVAKRYLPESLSQREKKPFPVAHYHPGSFDVPPGFLKHSFVRQMFGLTDRELEYLVNHASHDLKWKMFQLEVWVETCLQGQPGDKVMQRLQPNLSVLRVA